MSIYLNIFKICRLNIHDKRYFMVFNIWCKFLFFSVILITITRSISIFSLVIWGKICSLFALNTISIYDAVNNTFNLFVIFRLLYCEICLSINIKNMNFQFLGYTHLMSKFPNIHHLIMFCCENMKSISSIVKWPW